VPAKGKREPDTEVYDSSKLKKLEPREHVRKRPGMYIGSTGPKGIYHLIDEIVANSVDEAMGGHCTRIVVEVREDDWVEVSDDARGIPVDIHEDTGLSGLELVLTNVNAGGKWGDEDGGYKVSGGLHGVGASVVNILSEEMRATVSRDGHEWHQSYKRGLTASPLKRGKACRGTGTIIAWRFDRQIFDKGVKYDRTRVESRLRELSYLNPGVEFVLRFPGHKEQRFLSKAGIPDYIRHLVAEHEGVAAVHRQPIHLQGEVTEDVEVEGRMRPDTTMVDVALMWTSHQGEVPNTFVNCINTHDGGVHYDGLRLGLRRALSEAAEELGLLRPKDPRFEQGDTREGLFLVIEVRVSEPQFESQTKIRLGNVEVQKRVEQFVSRELKAYLLDKAHRVDAEAIIGRVIEARDGRLAASKARATVTARKGLLGASGLPGKLVDCSSRGSEGTELFIVEGDSATGGLKAKRDRVTQAILPLRGKIQNAEKAGEGTLDSDAIKDILSALGASVVPVQVQVKRKGRVVNASRRVVDLSEPRYGKVVICSVDGEEMTFVKDVQGQTQCVRIGAFVDGLCADGVDPGQYQVLCFGLEGKETRWRPLRGVVRHEIEEPLHLIKTAYGRSVRVTSSHSVFAFEDGEAVLKRGDEIREGDMLLAPRRLPLAGPGPLAPLDLLMEFHSRPQLARRVMLRGPGILRLYRQRVCEGLAGTHHAHERVCLEPHVWRRLREAREGLGINLQDMAEACGTKRVRSVSEWEAGRRRPSVVAMRSYCERVNVDSASVITEESRIRSVIARLQGSAEGSVNGERVRSSMRLSEVSTEELEGLGDDFTMASENHGPTTAMGRYLPLDKDIFFLLGLFTAEGSVAPRSGVKFSLGPTDEVFLDEIEQASQRLFGRLTKRYKTGGLGFEVRIGGLLASFVFGDLFGFAGGRAHTKEVPPLVFNAPPDMQLEFLRGYFLGDGCYRLGRASFTTVSEGLAAQIIYLLQVHGVMATHSVTPAREREWEYGYRPGSYVSHCLPVHTVTISSRDDMSVVKRIWETRHRDPIKDGTPLPRLDEALLSDLMDAEQVAAYARCSAATVRRHMHEGRIPVASKRGRARLAGRGEVVKWAESCRQGKAPSNRRFVEVSQDLVALPVTGCEVVEPSSPYVYDFSVEADENFICGWGGVCAHNSDADVDGGHIATLLMTFFYRFTPDLIREGRLWFAELPLYRVEHKKEGRLYVQTDEDLQRLVDADVIKGRPDGTLQIMRFKGLGEMQADTLGELALDPATRRLRRIMIDDLAEAEDATVLFMGSRVGRRREYIEEHALDVEADV
jgi:DNA gyrase subunit B